MKNQISELCDLILDFGQNLYPIIMKIRETDEESFDETKQDIADIKRMLEKQRARDSYHAPAYLDDDYHGSDEDEDIEPSRSFFIKDKDFPLLAVADLSRIDRDTVKEYLNQEVSGTWFFFNRLNVPKAMRSKGVAKKLLYKVIVWADKNQYNILNVINPYGDLTMKQLTNLYEKFGFEKISKGLMVRKHIVHVENVYDDVEEEEDDTDHVSTDQFINDQEKNEFFNGHLKGK